MSIVLISPPAPLRNETKILNRLFDRGLRTYHLRKPDYSVSMLQEYIDGIHVEYRDRIMLHQHHELAHIRGLKV